MHSQNARKIAQRLPIKPHHERKSVEVVDFIHGVALKAKAKEIPVNVSYLKLFLHHAATMPPEGQMTRWMAQINQLVIKATPNCSAKQLRELAGLVPDTYPIAKRHLLARAQML
ncbi:MAG: hypothetical protein NUV67_02460 [archaeon]|nr:hypothetical protein [archaeon]